MVTYLPPSIIACVYFSSPGFIEVFQDHTSVSYCFSLSAEIFMAAILHKCHHGVISSCWLGEVVIARRGRVIRRKCQLMLAFACRKGHIYEGM